MLLHALADVQYFIDRFELKVHTLEPLLDLLPEVGNLRVGVGFELLALVRKPCVEMVFGGKFLELAVKVLLCKLTHVVDLIKVKVILAGDLQSGKGFRLDLIGSPRFYFCCLFLAVHSLRGPAFCPLR